MQTKTNFTYKEFIQKLSNVQFKKSSAQEIKSPRVLKSQNNNVRDSDHNKKSQKIFQNNQRINLNQSSNKSYGKASPTKISFKENQFLDIKDGLTNARRQIPKFTTNKLKLKNQNVKNMMLVYEPKTAKNSSKTQQIKGNSGHNQSQYFLKQQGWNNNASRHLQSCSTFSKNFNFQNQQDLPQTNRYNISLNKNKNLSNSKNKNYQNRKFLNSSLDALNKLNKQPSTPSIGLNSKNNAQNPKFKINCSNSKNTPGRFTDRSSSFKISSQINTQYEYSRSYPTDRQHQLQDSLFLLKKQRMNTQYENYNKQSSCNSSRMMIKQSQSFYHNNNPHQKSMISESNFLDFGQNDDLSDSSLFGNEVSTQTNGKNIPKGKQIGLHPKNDNKTKQTINISLPSSKNHNKSTTSTLLSHKKSQHKHNNSIFQQQQNSFLNQKSYQHAYNRFITSISQKLVSITKIQDQTQLLQHKVKYIEYLQCLKQMDLIKHDYQPYHQTSTTNEIDLVRQMWQQLIAGHNVNHFIIIIAIILKITPIQRINQVEDTENGEEQCFEINKQKDMGQFLYLQKKYQQFRFRRLEITRSKVYSEKQSMEYYNYPFKPTISKKSDQISHKSRIRNQQGTSHSQNLSTSNLYIKNSNNQSVNNNYSNSHNPSHNISQTHQNRFNQNTSINTQLGPITSYNQSQMSELSFVSPSSNSNRSICLLGSKRSQILYKQGKKKSLQKRQLHDKSTIDYQYEKNVDELTFKPKIMIKRKKGNGKNNEEDNFYGESISNPMMASGARDYISPRFIEEEEKAINRMIRGRVQRQVKKLTVDKGLPYNQKVIDKLRKQKFQQILKQQQQSRLKLCTSSSLNQNQSQSQISQNRSKFSILSISPALTKSSKQQPLPQTNIPTQQTYQKHNRCTTQIQNLQSILDMSFQELNSNIDQQQKQKCSLSNHNNNKNGQAVNLLFDNGNFDQGNSESFKNNNVCSLYEQMTSRLPLEEYSQGNRLLSGNGASNKDNRFYQMTQNEQKYRHDKGQTQQQQSHDEQSSSSALQQQYFTMDIYYSQEKSDKMRVRMNASMEEMYAQAQRFVIKHDLSYQMQMKLKQQLTIAMRFYDVQKIEQNAQQQQCSLLM